MDETELRDIETRYNLWRAKTDRLPEMTLEIPRLIAEVRRLKQARRNAQWVPDTSLGDNWPLPHWRCTGCGEIIGCHGKPERNCENCDSSLTEGHEPNCHCETCGQAWLKAIYEKDG
jgi:hypothetical protein